MSNDHMRKLIDVVTDSYSDKFLINLLDLLRKKYPGTEFEIIGNKVKSNDDKLVIIAGKHETDKFVGVCLLDVDTGPYRGVLKQAIQNTTEKLLEQSQDKDPALFIVRPNKNPKAWEHIAESLGYPLIQVDEESLSIF